MARVLLSAAVASPVAAVLKLSREIFHLEQQERAIRARREAKKVELARLLSTDGRNLAAVRPDFRAGSLPAQVLDAVGSGVQQSFTAEQLAEMLGREVSSIRAVLSRLKSLGHVEKAGRGEYRLATGEGALTDVTAADDGLQNSSGKEGPVGTEVEEKSP